MMTRWVAGVVVLFGILIMMLPKTDEQSKVKIGSASMLMCTREFRQEVERQLLANRPASAEFSNHCPELVDRIEMDTEGNMVIAGRKYPVRMTLRPVMEHGGVRWSCVGEPADRITNLCKP